MNTKIQYTLATTAEDLKLDFLASAENVNKIVSFIKLLPNKYKLKTRFVDSLNLHDNGIDTAINSSRIASFYLQYHKNSKKSTTVLPTPALNSEPYDKLNNLLKLCKLYYVEEEKPNEPKYLTNLSDADRKSLNNRLLKAMCHRMMNALLYEDYFNVDFRYGNAHKIIDKMILPISENELYQLFNNWNNRESDVRGLLFYADTIPVVTIIEKYA